MQTQTLLYLTLGIILMIPMQDVASKHKGHKMPPPTSLGTAQDVETAAKEPAAEESAVEEPAAEESTAEESTADESTVEESTADESTSEEVPAEEQPCDSNIFCYGELLDTVQMKTTTKTKDFVDMSLKKKAEDVLAAFNDMKTESDGNMTRDQVVAFVNDNFDGPGIDYSVVIPDDWQAAPKFLSAIKDAKLKDWASNLNVLWKNLSIKVNDNVQKDPSRYSIIWMENPVVVPGGRYREVYYWDSYWTIKGLLLCEMAKTVKGMIDNFLRMVDTYGLVPNGARIYYSRRSQPPYLIPMMSVYLQATDDKQFLRDNIDTLTKEFEFWKEKRSVTVTLADKTYTLFHYDTEASGPRPEEYRADVKAASSVTNNKALRNEIYKDIKTGAETGWDYSSRWFIKDSTNKWKKLENTHARSVVPVDLNSILCYNARILAGFYKDMDNKEMEDKYNEEADKLQDAIEKVLWNETGSWFDYDLKHQKQRPFFYLSNMYPLWAGCYGKNEDRINKVLHYLTETSGALNYKYGVPTSVYQSGQQWDMPNGWAPLQHMLIQGLDNTDNPQAQNLAFNLTQRWIGMNYKVFAETGFMYERYHVVKGRKTGGAQTGFGWTNGVALDLLEKYGDRLSSEGKPLDVQESTENENVEKTEAPGGIKADATLLLWTGAAAIVSITIFVLCWMKTAARRSRSFSERAKRKKTMRGTSVEEMPLRPDGSDSDDSDTEFRIS